MSIYTKIGSANGPVHATVCIECTHHRFHGLVYYDPALRHSSAYAFSCFDYWQVVLVSLSRTGLGFLNGATDAGEAKGGERLDLVYLAHY